MGIRPDEEFDEAICIEVLEHIEHPEPFLEEISRIVRQRALFSVPNIEVIPYFKDWETVPWHMLEGDHKNFFTRTSLRELLAPHFSHVEVFSYSEHPLRTRDGIALHAHLCAVAATEGTLAVAQMIFGFCQYSTRSNGSCTLGHSGAQSLATRSAIATSIPSTTAIRSSRPPDRAARPCPAAA